LEYCEVKGYIKLLLVLLGFDHFNSKEITDSNLHCLVFSQESIEENVDSY
jgi:hypothetical protein